MTKEGKPRLLDRVRDKIRVKHPSTVMLPHRLSIRHLVPFFSLPRSARKRVFLSEKKTQRFMALSDITGTRYTKPLGRHRSIVASEIDSKSEIPSIKRCQ